MNASFRTLTMVLHYKPNQPGSMLDAASPDKTWDRGLYFMAQIAHWTEIERPASKRGGLISIKGSILLSS